MQTEFEVRILDVDVKMVVSRLHELGAVHRGEHLQRRYIYDFTPVQENSWIRLRTDGKKTTLTIKDIQSDAIDGTKELEISVDDFDKTNQILVKLGYVHRNYQENRRISYLLDSVEVDIDFWPLIPPYVEIEGNSAADVEHVVKLLGYLESQTTAIGNREIYRTHGIDVVSIKELKFEGK